MFPVLRDSLKKIRFAVAIVIPFNLEKWSYFSSRLSICQDGWRVDSFNRDEFDEYTLILSSENYTEVRVLYLTCALFGWKCGAVSSKNLQSENENKEIFSSVTISGVKDKKNSSYEIAMLLKNCDQLMTWSCENEPPIQLINSKLKTRFLWSCYDDLPLNNFNDSFAGKGLALFPTPG